MTPWDDDAAAPGLAPLKSKATDLDPFFYAGEPVVPPRMDLPVASPIPGVAVQPGRATPSGLVGLSMRAHELLGLPQPAEYEKFQKLPPAPPVITPPDNDSGIADWEPVRRDVDVGQSALNFAPQVVGAVAEGAGDIARGAGQSVGALGRLAEWAYPQYQQVEKALAAKGAGQEVDGVTPPPPKFTPQSDGTFTSADISAAAGQQPDLAKAYARSGEWLDLAGDAMKGWARDNTPDRQVPSVDMVKDWRTALVYGMESVAQATGSTVPTLAAYAVSGPFAAAIPTYAMSVGQMRDSMERAGIDPREQDAIILAGGAVMGRIEMMSHGALSDLFKEQLGKHVVRRMMTAGGRGGATEGLEEILQEATQIAGEAIAKGENVGLALLSDEGLARIKEAGAQAFVGGFGIGAGGTGLRYARQATAEQIKSWADARERVAEGDTTAAPSDIGLTSIYPEAHGDGKSSVLAQIRVYHGSPYDFDEFSDEKIGTGEGAQAFGYGHYVAESQGVAASYRNALGEPRYLIDGEISPDDRDVQTAAFRLRQAANASDDNVVATKAHADAALERWTNDTYGFSSSDPEIASTIAPMRATLGSLVGKTIGRPVAAGSVYTINLNTDPQNLIDWDAPWSSQSDAVKAAVAKFGMSEDITAPTMEGTEPTGATVYMRMAREIQNRDLAKIDKPGLSPAEKRLDYGRNTEPDVSRMLASAGVPGIRYLDQASRSKGDGTRNYVVFDPKILEITHKNGEPVKKELRDQIVSEVAPLAQIRGFHGSPHDFDRFDSSKIGSGEGAQSFGHGLYFAENMAVADQYRRELALDKGQYIGPVYSRKELEELSKAAKSSDQKEAIDWILWLTRRSEKEGGYSFKQAVSTSSLLTLKDAFGDSHVRLPGHIYEVRLDVEPHQLLDWDKPLSDQIADVKWFLGYSNERPDELTGRAIIETQRLIARENGFSRLDSERYVSKELKSMGIVGIRYFDAGSRGTQDGTRNIVIFPGEDHRIKIVAKNGQPVSEAERKEVLSQLFPGEAKTRAEKFKAWKEKKEAEKLIEPKATAEIISSRLAAGMSVPIPDRLSGAIIDMVAPMRSIVPEGARVGVVANIRPNQSNAETAIVDVRTLDGNPFAVIVNRDQMLNSKALFLPRSNAIVLLPFDEFDRLAEGTHGGLVEDLTAIIRGSFVHEMTHLLSRSGVMTADDFRRLVDHSNLLGVLDLPVRDYFRLNGTPDYNSVPVSQTIRKAYESLYSKFADVQEAIDQEAAAIFMEMVNRGAVDKASAAPVQDIIERYFSGSNRTEDQPLFSITGRSKAPSLVAAIREMGGIRDVTGDIRKMMGARPGQSGYIPGIINKNGVHPDKAREALVNGGWLLETVGDGEARTTVNDLYDLLDRMFRGERVHPQTPSDITEHLDLMDEERGVVAQEQYDEAVAQVIERVDAYIDEHGLAPLTERERRRLSTIASPSWTNDDIDSALEELYIETVEIADATAKAGLTAAEDLRVLELQKQGMDIADAIEQAKQETFARMEESEARAAGLERREDAAGGEPGAIDSRGAGASSQGNGRASAQQGQLVFPLPPAVPPGTGGAPALPATTAGSGGFGGIPPLSPRGGFTPPPGGRPPGGPPAGGLPPPTYPHATPGRAPGLIGRAWNAFLGWYNPVNRIPQANRYRIGKYKTLGKIARANDIARSIWEDLHKASNRDQRAAYDYLTTRGATPNTIGDAKVRRAAIDAKRIIDMLGQALVSRGLIPQQSYDKYRDQYLPRIYLKHMIERHGGSLSGFANAAMGYTKQRKEIDKEARLLMGEITDPGFLAARGILRTYRDIALIDFLDTISQNHSWVFDRGLVPFKGRNVSPFWLKAEAEELSYRAIFEPDSANRQRMISEANAMRALAVPYIRDNENVPDGYAQIPDTQRYGMLRGMWVRKEIKEDLLPGMEILPDDASSLQRFFSPNGYGGRASSLWKAMKVPMNPATQVRNFISNMIMLNLSGMGPVDIPRYIGRAAAEMYTDGHYYKAAKSRGLAASGFSEQELVKISREFLDIDRKLARQSSFFPILYPFVIARELATRVIGLSGEFYQKAESLTKLAKMIHDVEQSGRSIDDAYLEAQKWLFDYSEVPSSIRYLRNVPFGAPFITYFYKAFPVLLEAAATKPWRLAPYVALPHIAAAFFAFLHDVDKDDVEKLKQSLPEFLRSKENAMMLPVKDAAGRWQFFDFGYLLPWSMFQEAGTQAAKGDAAEAIRTAGLLGGPIADMIVTLKTGIDPFTKRPIYDKRDPPQDQMRDIMSYLARATLPPWMTDQSFALKMWDAYKQNPTKYGDPPLTMGQAAARGFGMNVYPVEPEVSRARSLKKFDSEIRDLQSRMRQQLRDRRLSDDERQKVAQKYGDMITKAKQRKEEYTRKSEINPKLLAGHDGQDHSKINDWQPVAQPSGGPGDWVPVRP